MSSSRNMYLEFFSENNLVNEIKPLSPKALNRWNGTFEVILFLRENISHIYNFFTNELIKDESSSLFMIAYILSLKTII